MVSDTFLETLRGSRQPQEASPARSGELSPGQTVDFGSMEEKATALEKQYWQKFYRQAEYLRQEEKGVHEAREQQIEAQVQSLQEELSQMAKAAQELEKQVQIASVQTTAKVGVYHIRYFEKLRHFIKAFRAKIEDSSAWLAAFNSRSRKKNYYWSQVKKSGAQFMLSGERTAATQSG